MSDTTIFNIGNGDIFGRYDLLWENPDHTSSYSTGDIYPKNADAYPLFVMMCLESTTSNDMSISLIINEDFDGKAQVVHSRMCKSYRTVMVRNNNNGTYLSVYICRVDNPATALYPSRLIPYRIYGIR